MSAPSTATPRTVYCLKYQATLPGLPAPVPGPMGPRIYANISEKAWQDWLGHQTMLINEYRLNLRDSAARQFLAQEMATFLFGDPSAGACPDDSAAGGAH